MVIMKSPNFGDVTPCSLLEVHRRFEGTYFFVFLVACLLNSLFGIENGGNNFLRNIGELQPNYMHVTCKKTVPFKGGYFAVSQRTPRSPTNFL